MRSGRRRSSSRCEPDEREEIARPLGGGLKIRKDETRRTVM